MGWPKELFQIDDEDRKFICSICLDVFRKPMSLQCHHTFCEECIRKWVYSRIMVRRISDFIIPTCPICRHKIGCNMRLAKLSDGTYRMLKPTIELRNPPKKFRAKLYAIKMKCINESKGCKDKFLYSELISHFQSPSWSTGCLFKTEEQVREIGLDSYQIIATNFYDE